MMKHFVISYRIVQAKILHFLAFLKPKNMENFKKMQILNPNAAGIDIGSRSHFVAVGQEENEIKEFNVYQSGSKDLVEFLKAHSIETVAMESTGSYWQSLFLLLQEEGFE